MRILDRVGIDTNVFAGALVGGTGYNRRVIRDCLYGAIEALMGQAPFLEYEDVLRPKRDFPDPRHSRDRNGRNCSRLFLSVCEWVQIYFSWRPNLPDEAGQSHLWN